ncbi:unnamed protein product [Mytilus coruscus]|uniref:Uncharacterized protein n=1 Tax=Mytilus coruscus TaxID=42192 RepID=A0A6J8AKK1_MYTCO|nr:unnamed protein product [Mytilus coruscus]
MSDRHYLAVIELLGEETKARQHLEVAVTHLHRDLVAKTSNIAAFQDQTNLIRDLTSKLQNMENKTELLEQKYQQVKSENAAISKGYLAIQQKYLILEGHNSKMQSQQHQLLQKLLVHENKTVGILKELTALKQLKAIDQHISALQTDTETLKRQIHSLTSNQAASGQDFLALYNQTLVSWSGLALDIAKISKQNNDSFKEIIQNIKRANQTTYQLKKQTDYDIKRLQQKIADENLGYAGGGKYDESGSAAEPVCLPKDPDFVKTSGTGYGRMYGAEFGSNTFASNSRNQDVPCAVCRVKHASSVIMIPGKNMCYTGWSMEYNGYLASNEYNHPAAGSYVCIDIQPEYVSSGSSWNSKSKLFYDVVVKCGSLRCPPNKQDYPLTCVVCSK